MLVGFHSALSEKSSLLVLKTYQRQVSSSEQLYVANKSSLFRNYVYTFDITRNKPYTRLGFIFQIKLKGDSSDVGLNLASFDRRASITFLLFYMCHINCVNA